MSGGLPIACPLCRARTTSSNRRSIDAPDGADGGLQQYRLCTNPKCLHNAKSFKAIITWSLGGTEDRAASDDPL